jgi:2-dehydro-3-deoxy-D-arabinonate dehydratase
MTARSLEGENLLYLPQAKVYDRSCALGPWIVVGVSEAEVRRWPIQMTVIRGGEAAFAGEACVGTLRRPFADLVSYLHRSQIFPHGVVLLTGTGIVPPAEFGLRTGDRIRIEIPAIGTLENPVVTV